MKKHEFTGTNELSEMAFDVYSNSDFTFYKKGEVEALMATETGAGIDKELAIVSWVRQSVPQSKYRVKDGTKPPQDFESWLEAVECYNAIQLSDEPARKPYSRDQFLEEMRVICMDFFGEKKTKKAVKDMWALQLENLHSDGYAVDMKWKPTKEELEELVR